MKRLVLCCDGTWSHAGDSQVSNIVKLVRSIPPGVSRGRDGRDVVQLVSYVGGVGAHGHLADRLLGGAFGYGLDRNVMEGYRFLASAYEPGDEIVILGYSRGAYTARSVVGMISQLGLLTYDAIEAGMFGEAGKVYRLRCPGSRRQAWAEASCSRRVRGRGVGAGPSGSCAGRRD